MSPFGLFLWFLIGRRCPSMPSICLARSIFTQTTKRLNGGLLRQPPLEPPDHSVPLQGADKYIHRRRTANLKNPSRVPARTNLRIAGLPALSSSPVPLNDPDLKELKKYHLCFNVTTLWKYNF